MSTTGISSATFPRKSFFCCFLKLSWSWVYYRCWNQKRFSICNYTTVRNCYAYSKITNDQKRGLRTILKTHFSITIFRKKFSFFCKTKKYVGGLYAHAKYKKPSKTGLSTCNRCINISTYTCIIYKPSMDTSILFKFWTIVNLKSKLCFNLSL